MIKNNKKVRTFNGHFNIILDLDCSINCRFLSSASTWDQKVKLWSMQSAKQIRTLLHKSNAICTTISPDTKIVLSGTLD